MFCPDFFVVGANDRVVRIETAVLKICAMPKTGSQDLVA
jgi:hypothetical protein